MSGSYIRLKSVGEFQLNFIEITVSQSPNIISITRITSISNGCIKGISELIGHFGPRKSPGAAIIVPDGTTEVGPFVPESFRNTDNTISLPFIQGLTQ